MANGESFFHEKFQGGKSARIINCVLALKSYNEWRLAGGNGTFKFCGNLKPSTSVNCKKFMRRNAEPFMQSFSRASSVGEKSVDGSYSEQASCGDPGHDLNETVSELCCL